MGKFKEFLCKKLGHKPVRYDHYSVCTTIRCKNGISEHIETRWPHFLIQCKRCGEILAVDSWDLKPEIEHVNKLSKDFDEVEPKIIEK